MADATARPGPQADLPDEAQLTLFTELDRSLPPSPVDLLGDGRDDMNLVELLLGVARSRRVRTDEVVSTPWEPGDRSYHVRITERSYRIEWEAVAKEKGKSVRRSFYLAVDAGAGLPNPYVEDVLIALLKLSSDGHTMRDTVRTSRYRLLETMQWPGKSKYYYQRLEDTLDHMASMTIRTDSLWNPATGTYWKFTFNLLDSTGMELDEQNVNAEIVIRWAPTALKLLQVGYAKPLDTQFYYSLQDPTTRRIYRWLDKQFRFRPRVEVDVLYLAHRVLGYGITWAYPSKIIQKLGPKLDELRAKGFCTWDVSHAGTDSGRMFVFHRVTPYNTVVHPDVPSVTAALIARGLYQDEAEAFLQRYGLWSCLRQLEHYEHKVRQGTQVRSSRQWIKAAIAYRDGQGYTIPPPLAHHLHDADRTIVTWCAEKYKSLTDQARESVNRRAMSLLDARQQHQLHQGNAHAQAAFQRARNHVLVNAAAEPGAASSRLDEYLHTR